MANASSIDNEILDITLTLPRIWLLHCPLVLKQKDPTQCWSDRVLYMVEFCTYSLALLDPKFLTFTPRLAHHLTTIAEISDALHGESD